jgi:uncharacterized membrane protein YqhA
VLKKYLTSSRYIIVIAVIGSFLASVASLVAGGVQIIREIIHVFSTGVTEEAIKVISVSFLEAIDLFLIGVVFYIISLGLYELFIDDALDLPSWLVVRNLDDLKDKLLSSIVVVMGVDFLGVLVNWDGKSDLLHLSISTALMIFALTVFQYITHLKEDHE